MDKTELSKILENNYSKNDILYLVRLSLNKIIKVKNVLELSFDENPQVAFRAAWLLENIVIEYPYLFEREVKDFLKCYHLQKNESAKRCFSKIAIIVLQWAALYKVSYKHFEYCLSASFDWLLNDNTSVAIKCNCIDLIYDLSHHENWILEELKPILEKNLLTDSPALLSRIKKILKAIK